MTTSFVLDKPRTFLDVPVKATARGFALPYPPVLRVNIGTGKPQAKDKEWDGHLTPHPANGEYCLATIEYRNQGRAGVTKRVTSAVVVTENHWKLTLPAWRQVLEHADDWTNTHALVKQAIASRVRLNVSRVTTPSVAVAPAAFPAAITPGSVAAAEEEAPEPDQVEVAVTQFVDAQGADSGLQVETPRAQVTIEWDPSDPQIANDLFHVPAADPGFVMDAEARELLDATWALIQKDGIPRFVIFYGHTSTGKSELPQVWCNENDILHCRIDCGGFQEVYDVTGPIMAKEQNGVSVTEWIKGKTVRAMADPRPAVIQLDEGNRIADAKAMNILFPFFDSARRSYFDEAQAWMELRGAKLVILTMNGNTKGDDIGDYVGTQPLDQAFISRFPIRKQFRYPEQDKLVTILQRRAPAGIDPADIDKIASVAQELVALNKYVPNLRELIQCLNFMGAGYSLYRALKWTVGGIYENNGTADCDWASFAAVMSGKGVPMETT